MKPARAAVCLLVAVLYSTTAMAADNLKIIRRVTYTRRGLERQMLDVYTPAVAAPGAPNSQTARPAVLVIHGGGFVGGVRQQMDPLCRELAARGLVVFNVDYRLGPQHKFPAGIEDVRCALRFVAARARDYGADPDRIGVTGESAGAYLSAMVAYPAADNYPDPGCAIPGPVPPVRAAALYYGVYDLERSYYLPFPAIHQMYWLSLGASPRRHPERFAPYAVEPVVEQQAHAGRTLPPTLLLVGDADPLYPETLLFYQKLRGLGQEAELEVYPGADHAFAVYARMPAHKPGLARAADYLRDQLSR